MIGPDMIEALFAQITNDMHIPTVQAKTQIYPPT